MSVQARARRLEKAGHEPGLELVRRRSRRLIQRQAPRRFAPVAIAVVILVGTTVFGVLLEQVILAQSAFKMAGVRDHLSKSEARHQALLLEMTRLESPARLERVARDELGMTQSSAVEYIAAEVPLRRGIMVATSSQPPSQPAPPGWRAALGSSP
ncbi:MAG: cell division protein FtsL [Actinobacteria bacterium]|nr:cell division protein FtsL [Actinomycetota bacterium]